MARGGARPGSGFSKGGKAYAGEPKGPGKGDGYGGPASGTRPAFSATVRPDPEVVAVNKASKEELFAYLAAKNMTFARAIVDIAEDMNNPQRLAAANSGLDRLYGKPTQGTPGGDGEQRTAHTFVWGDGST